ncbi:hypothetical protein [Xanthomonas translucens]|jgi:hypothetical protein|uniref:hypothetical protein n=1 Tax=Xanthomonas campestris pv. translucens TaxID=343 RepID=UPI0021B82A80|nr:hypothetical protein [Xanthomonas translucens]MCT8275006.1 hypothetical protein [Xanthomonas translucens pv. translucens]MCT8278855.1 hypothetical protein [Xanthomonas translucens pv. translucens]WLA10124.1 hypothetical protein MO328_08510 [Xanthomonas translucens]WNJ27688.1 hypothetical protein RMA73_03350 [Xanthomonas translucens pv. translucens]
MKVHHGVALGLAMVCAGLSPLCKAAEPTLNPADVIDGMGERVPPAKENVSLSPLFKAYVFEKAGLKFVQINSLQDDVITVIVATPGAESRLPIGSAAGQPLPVLKGDATS